MVEEMMVMGVVGVFVGVVGVGVFVGVVGVFVGVGAVADCS